MSYLNKFKNNYVEIADYRLFYLGLDYDLKIKEYNINQKEINEKMQINDFIYLRKNNYKIKSNIIIRIYFINFFIFK